MSNFKLTDKQEKYVQGLLKGLTQRKAFKQAYDTSKMTDKSVDEKASKLLANSKVRARYDELRERLRKEAEDKGIISAIDILKDIIEVKDRCMSKEPVLNNDGEEVGEWKFEHNGALKALEMLGKHINFFEHTKIKDEKTVAETEYIKTKTSILKGDVKDVDKLERIMKALGD